MTDEVLTNVNLGNEIDEVLKQLSSSKDDFVDPSIVIPSIDELDIDTESWLALLESVKVPTKNLTTEDLTNDENTGSIDTLLTKLKAELMEEYNQGRITGAEYTKTYAAMVAEVMSQGVQFALQKDSNNWQAKGLQAQALSNLFQASIAKANIAKTLYETNLLRVNFYRAKLENALVKAQINTEIKKQLMLDAQIANMEVQSKLYNQQIASFRARDTMQGLAPLQSMWSAAMSMGSEVIPPAQVSSAGINLTSYTAPGTSNNVKGLGAALEEYLSKAQNGTYYTPVGP